MAPRHVQPARPSLGKEGDQMAAVIGYDATLLLINAMPASGSRSWRRCLYVPARLPVDHMLVRVLGMTLALRLVDAFGGRILQPSNGSAVERRAKEEAVLTARRAGLSPREIEARLDIPVSTVRSIIQRRTIIDV